MIPAESVKFYWPNEIPSSRNSREFRRYTTVYNVYEQKTRGGRKGTEEPGRSVVGIKV